MQHTGRRPCVKDFGIGGILSVRKPHRRKMHSAVVGTVYVFAKLKGGVIADADPVKEPPVGFIIKFGEIGNHVLRPGDMAARRVGVYGG